MSTKKPAAKKAPAKKIATKKPAAVAAKPAKAAAVALPEPSGVYAEWLKALGMKHDPALAFSAVAVKICEEAAKLSDEDFGKRGAEAQKWFNDAGDAINKGEKNFGNIPVLDGFPTADAPTAAAGKTTKPTKAAKETKPGKESPIPGARMNPDGVTYRMFATVVQNGPAISFEDACKKAGIKGEAAETGSHAWNKYLNARQVIMVAQAHKAYKQPAAAA